LLPFTGRIFLFDQELVAMDRKQRAQQLSWLGQNESASDDLRVWDVVMLGRMPHQDWLAAPNAHDQAVVETALKATQAWDWRERALGQLSGGERQRVAVARALMGRPALLLADEPTASLDRARSAEMVQLLAEQTHRHGAATVLVTHDPDGLSHADRVLTLVDGRLTGA